MKKISLLGGPTQTVAFCQLGGLIASVKGVVTTVTQKDTLTMKRFEWFYLISAILGFTVDLGTVAAFYLKFGVSFVGIAPTARSGYALLSILALFYGMFAFASWRYWIWLDVYSQRVVYWNEVFEKWNRDRKQWEKQEEARRARIREEEARSRARGEAIFFPIIYEIAPPLPPSKYGRQGVYLTIGLGILSYPLIAIWGLTFIPDIIWATSNIEFALLLLLPFALSGVAVLTAVITVNGIQYFLG